MNDLIERLEQAERPGCEEIRDWCDDPCHIAPIHGFTWLERQINWLCWLMIVRVVPVRWTLSWPFRWMLPLCGNHAYGCTCPDKNRRARLAACKARAEGEV